MTHPFLLPLNPADPTWGVYADWLRDHGREAEASAIDAERGYRTLGREMARHIAPGSSDELRIWQWRHYEAICKLAGGESWMDGENIHWQRKQAEQGFMRSDHIGRIGRTVELDRWNGTGYLYDAIAPLHTSPSYLHFEVLHSIADLRYAGDRVQFDFDDTIEVVRVSWPPRPDLAVYSQWAGGPSRARAFRPSESVAD